MPHVAGALLYLWRTSLFNSARSRLQRLRQPKYILGAVVGVAYLYFAFFRMPRTRRGLPAASELATGPSDTAIFVGALMLSLVWALCWLWSRERASLNFTESEIAFLFPAPIKRRTLIHYRLIRLQLGLIFTALILALFSSRWSFVSGDAAIRIVGWWTVFATFSLHSVGSAFVITRWLDRSLTQPRRQLMMSGLFALAIAIALAIAWRKLQAPDVDDLAGIPAFVAYLARQCAETPLAWLLLPAKLVVRPLFATDASSLLIALGPALLILAAHYLWVLRAEVSFEEASIAKAAKRAAKLAAFRAGKYGVATAKARRAPFDLSAVRRPELAFLWKNLLSSAEYLRPRTAIIAALIIVVGGTWLSNQHSSGYEAIRSSIGFFAIVIAVYLVALGPQIARQDLRGDLLNADILKTYPLRGWQIVLGEILTPAAIVTVSLWLALLAAALTFEPPQRMQWLTPQLRAPIALGLALAMPLLCMLQLLVVNAATLLFPAWSQTGRRGPPSIETMGQGIFFLAGQLIVMALTLIPAAIAAGAAYFALQWMIGVPIAVLLSAVVACAVLAAEVCLGAMLLGTRFDKFDLSAELRP